VGEGSVSSRLERSRFGVGSNPEDEVIDPGAMTQLDPDNVSRAGGPHGSVIDLHRLNALSEIRRGPDHSDRVANPDLAGRHFNSGDLDPREGVADSSNEVLFHCCPS
jgi:hypothetical protein